MLRIAILGYIVRGPLGGLVWHHLQYVLGLAKLGHDVWFVEDSDNYDSCYEPARGVTTRDPTYGLAFAHAAFGHFGLNDRWAYFDSHTNTWHGPLGSHAPRLCASADVVLNLSAINPLRPWTEKSPVRVLIDTDPVFLQIRHVTDPAARALAAAHTDFFSFGENIESGNSKVPDDGFPWRATRQPIVLDAWTVTPGPQEGRFTTVMQWDSYAAREYNGVKYGMKSESFGPFLDLPAKAGPLFELALGGHSAPSEMLSSKGWAVRDSREPTATPCSYQDYLRKSKGEFGLAKQGYVLSNSGWFSERTAVYLASGRPAVVQDTGFSEWLKVDAGVAAFTTPDEALDAIRDVNARYAEHCRAAREIAETYFDSAAVLTSLLARVRRT